MCDITSAAVNVYVSVVYLVCYLFVFVCLSLFKQWRRIGVFFAQISVCYAVTHIDGFKILYTYTFPSTGWFQEYINKYS